MTKTWLNSNYTDNELQLRNYTVFRLDRNVNTSSFRMGGGVLFAVRDGISCTSIHTISNHIEQLSIKLNDYNIILEGIYLPPRSDREMYVGHALDIVKVCSDNPNCKTIVTGDYN